MSPQRTCARVTAVAFAFSSVCKVPLYNAFPPLAIAKALSYMSLSPGFCDGHISYYYVSSAEALLTLIILIFQPQANSMAEQD